MSRRKVVIFSPSLDALSGVSTHVRLLLESSLARDYELVHFQVGSEGRDEGALQKLARYALSPLALAALLVTSGAEAVHLNASLEPKAYWRDLVYAAVARLLGRRVVNQVHGGAMPQDFFHGLPPLAWLLRRFLVSSDVVTVLSSAELEAYRNFDARIRVQLVPNAINPAGLADVPRAWNRDRPLRLVYVGRLVRAKGLFEAVEALGALRRAGRRFEFWIAGNGADACALAVACARAKLTSQVRFLGAVSGAAKSWLWLDSDVFVFPSHAEGLPYALLESMAAGCVPVTTPVAAIPDVMCGGEHGLFVPVRNPAALANAIARLDDDRELLRHMGLAARRRILQHYTVARLAEDFRQIYSACLA